MFQMVSEARSAVTDVTRDAGPGDRDAATAGFGGEQVTPVQHLGLGATGETGGGVPQRRPSAGTTAETVATGDGISRDSRQPGPSPEPEKEKKDATRKQDPAERERCGCSAHAQPR